MSRSEPDNTEQQDFATTWETVGKDYDYVQPRHGDIREGVILSIRAGEILLDIGAKRDAIVSNQDIEKMTPEELAALKVGDVVPVYIVRGADQNSNIIVSINLARTYEDWQRAQALLESGEIVRATVTGFNKGGLVCSFGRLHGFIPASHVSSLGRRREEGTHLDHLARFVGDELPLKVIEVNRRRRRLILSERAARREWHAQQRERLLAEIKEGEIRTGIVSNLCDFGAFVDLGGADGLIHISELSRSRVKHPSEVLQSGQEVEVLVLRVDQERQRIGLSLRRLQADPWTSVGERYERGELATGVVTHLVRFGAFVELEPGVEGLIHVSELAEGDFGDPANVVSEGEEVSALVLNVDPERRQIGLSLRRVPQEPPVSDEEETTSEGEEGIPPEGRGEVPLESQGEMLTESEEKVSSEDRGEAPPESEEPSQEQEPDLLESET